MRTRCNVQLIGETKRRLNNQLPLCKSLLSHKCNGENNKIKHSELIKPIVQQDVTSNSSRGELV